MAPAFLRPTKFSVSLMRLPLIFRSSGLSNASDGLRLTSSSHGLHDHTKSTETIQNLIAQENLNLKSHHLRKIGVKEDIVAE